MNGNFEIVTQIGNIPAKIYVMVKENFNWTIIAEFYTFDDARKYCDSLNKLDKESGFVAFRYKGEGK